MSKNLKKRFSFTIIYIFLLFFSTIFAEWVDVDGVAQESINVSNNTGDSYTPFLQINNFDNPCIAWSDYTDTTPTAEIYYLQWNGFTWTGPDNINKTSINVSNNTGDSIMPSLVIDKSNKPHIAWADNSSGNYEIYYLYWNGNAWVDVSGNG